MCVMAFHSPFSVIYYITVFCPVFAVFSLSSINLLEALRKSDRVTLVRKANSNTIFIRYGPRVKQNLKISFIPNFKISSELVVFKILLTSHYCHSFNID